METGVKDRRDIQEKRCRDVSVSLYNTELSHYKGARGITSGVATGEGACAPNQIAKKRFERGER